MSVAALAAFSLVLGASAQAAGGVVTVNFVEPDKFFDAGNEPFDKQANLRALQAHLQKLGEIYLAPGQTLVLDITDVDLAGQVRPSRRFARDIRIVKGSADWPRITLRYVLQTPGQAEQQGSETVADLGYQQHFNAYAATETLRYEKQMLNDWFKARFGPNSP
jgi:hypothetical protein